MTAQLGKILIVTGLLLVAAGVLMRFKESIPVLKYLGRLPGDIAIHGKNFHFYFPLTTSIIVSLLLSLIFWYFTRN